MEAILRSQGCIVVTHYCHVAWHMQTQLPGNAQNLESDEIRPKKERFGACCLSEEWLGVTDRVLDRPAKAMVPGRRRIL
jgi:hypothetical protein